jgi:fatty-acyl-CoA synthase
MNQGFILDENGNEVASGGEGEICVMGPAVMLGYYRDTLSTKEAIDEEGRLHTGDLGYLDENGNLHISGRKKDIIIRNGNNISIRRIEDALHMLPEISRAAVVGMTHEKLGEVPCALVVIKEDCCTSEEEIKNHLSQHLAKNELPERLLFSKALPLTSSGKPDKQKIKLLFS